MIINIENEQHFQTISEIVLYNNSGALFQLEVAPGAFVIEVYLSMQQTAELGTSTQGFSSMMFPLYVGVARKGFFAFDLSNKGMTHPSYVQEKLNLAPMEARAVAIMINKFKDNYIQHDI